MPHRGDIELRKYVFIEMPHGEESFENKTLLLSQDQFLAYADVTFRPHP